MSVKIFVTGAVGVGWDPNRGYRHPSVVGTHGPRTRGYSRRGTSADRPERRTGPKEASVPGSVSHESLGATLPSVGGSRVGVLRATESKGSDGPPRTGRPGCRVRGLLPLVDWVLLPVLKKLPFIVHSGVRRHPGDAWSDHGDRPCRVSRHL